MRERSLLRRARRWERDALGEIYDLYSDEIYRYAMRQMGNPGLAEECVGETFGRFLDALHKGGGPRRYLRAYLYRTAHHWIVDQLRGKPLDELDSELEGDDDAGPAVFVEDERRQLRRALAQLTPDQRQVVVLRFLEGWSLRDTAAAVEKPVGAVKALQRRGLAALKRCLTEERAYHETSVYEQ